MEKKYKVCSYVLLGITLVVFVLSELFQKNINILLQKSPFLITYSENKIYLETLNLFHKNFLQLVSCCHCI